MAKATQKLTALAVRNLKEPGRHGDGHGLYLQITNTGVKSWLLRYQVAGRERWLGLGACHTFSLAEARERARKARQLIADGIDPVDARKAERQARALAAARAITFETAARQYFDQHADKWRNERHRSEFLSSLRRYAFRHIGRVSVADIDTGLVLKVIEPIWHEKTETANRTRGRIESVLDWATVRGYRVGDNPARWRGHLSNVLPARSAIQRTVHHKALPFADLPSFMSSLHEREGVAARALEFTILTAARTGEVTGATWEEVDLEAKVWTIPGERMKGGREHRVPLTDRAVEILSELPRERENPFLFIGGRAGGPMSNMAMASVLRRMSRDDITVHGFRSTFRDWAAERTSYQNHVVEMALAHSVGNAVERAYRRGDLYEKRRRLMAEWAKYAMTKPAETGDKVVPIRRRAR